MSTGYSWEGIRQVRATLLGVPERLCGGHVYLRRYIKCSTFTLLTDVTSPGTYGVLLVVQFNLFNRKSQ